jgi:ATP-dependent DNA helicase RecQ
MIKTEISVKEALHKYFGFDTFKGEQEAIVNNLLQGNDSFVIMPTGGGKSLCYQLPALMMEGTAIIVSPLIALMKNQVDAIRNISDADSIAHFLNSSLNKTEITQVKEDITAGKTKLLYVAPESLVKQENIDFLHSIPISFVAIDEAHCISEWGHDFRPEYRRLRPIIENISNVPLIALTATATEKVQQDILKNLGMTDATVFKASFNRPNLYYEVRPKKQVVKEIIRYIRENLGKSGIIYCLSRKKVEEIAEVLQVNGIKSLPYHAGLDANTRARHQDMFLMEEADVIVATIAFGMGIDKPDVRFVIHHDMPKSLESYYQETGRAGRDGGEGVCIAFYSYKDIEKLEKFLYNKPLSEQEIGYQLLQEVVAYAETSMNRRKYILRYFGEEFDEINGPGANMCDNSRYPRERFEGKEFVMMLLELVQEFKEKHKSKFLVDVLLGNDSQEVESYRGTQSEFYGLGGEKDEKFWNAVIRQTIAANLLRKEIESYGLLKITDEGHKFMKKPYDFMLIKERDFSDVDDDNEIIMGGAQSDKGAGDPILLAMLKDLRKEIAAKKNVPPYVVFQEPSLEDMSIQYPITQEELMNIVGVGQGKAVRYGDPFLALIKKYVEENEIERPQDLVIKSLVNKSGLKVQIIRNIDKMLPLEDMAKAAGKELEDIVAEIESIVFSGTKVNIDYYLNEMLDEDQQDEIFDYFKSADSDDLTQAFHGLDGEYTEEELRLMRIKFISDLAN